MSDERRYTESELRTIIERAAERQEAVRRAQASSEGELTLDELQETGSASGIAPAHITAAKELIARDAAPERAVPHAADERSEGRIDLGAVPEETETERSVVPNRSRS